MEEKHISIANKQVDENYDCWTHKKLMEPTQIIVIGLYITVR